MNTLVTLGQSIFSELNLFHADTRCYGHPLVLKVWISGFDFIPKVVFNFFSGVKKGKQWATVIHGSKTSRQSEDT